MSEFSVKLHTKKGAARIQKAQKFLNDVKSEENKIIKQIQDIARPASESYDKLTQSRGTANFTKAYGSCLVTLQDTLSKLQDISRLLEESSDTEEEEEGEDEDTERHIHTDGDEQDEGEMKTEPPDTAPISESDKVDLDVDKADEDEADTEYSPRVDNIGPQTDLPKLFFDQVQQLYQSNTLKLDDMIDVACGYHQGPNYLWLQPSPTVVERIHENICLGLSNQMFPLLTESPVIGDLVLAKYTLDEYYYRAVVQKIDGAEGEEVFTVFFMDYGNIEVSPLSGLLDIGSELPAIPPQACLCSLDSVSPPIALGKYTEKTIEWFEHHINTKLRAKFYLCDDECPILLAKVYCSGKDISTEMIYHGYAVRIDNYTFKDKYEKMPYEMKDFYLSVQPQYTRKKEQVITPTRPPRQTSQSGTSSRSIATPVKTQVPKTATKSLPMPAEAAGSMREERIKELHQIQKQRIQNTIRANEKKLLDDIVADMGSKPSLSSTADDGAVGPENSEPTDLNMESSALLEMQQAEEVNQHTVTQQPTDDSSVKTTSTTHQKPAEDHKKIVDDETLSLLKSAFQRLCGPEFKQRTEEQSKKEKSLTDQSKRERSLADKSEKKRSVTDLSNEKLVSVTQPQRDTVNKCSVVSQAQLAKAVVKERRQSSDSTEEPINAAAHRMIKNSLGISDKGDKASPGRPAIREYVDEQKDVRYSSEADYKPPNANSSSRRLIGSGRIVATHNSNSASSDARQSWNITESWSKPHTDSNENQGPRQVTATTVKEGKLNKPVITQGVEQPNLLLERPDTKVQSSNHASGQQSIANSVKAPSMNLPTQSSTKHTQPQNLNTSKSSHNHKEATMDTAEESAQQGTTPAWSQQSKNEIRFIDAPIFSQALNDTAADCSIPLIMDTELLTSEVEIIEGSGIPLPPDTSSDLSLHGGRSTHSSGDMSVSSGSPEPQRDSTPEIQNSAETKPRSMDKESAITEQAGVRLDQSLSQQHAAGDPAAAAGDTTPQCLLSPPKCNSSAQVPAQTLEITDTATPKRVLISHINTPTDLYVNMCDKQTALQFTQVLENIGEYYDRIFNSMLRTMMGDYKPKLGDYCVAKSDQFGSYYRAEVVDLRDSKDMVINDLVVRKRSNKTVKAFFIDYGSNEWVSEDSVFPLMPQFGSVPPLAWHCSLADVFPLEGCKAEYPGGWDSSSVETLKSLISEGSVCDMYITNPRKHMINEVLQVILMVESEEDKSPVFINEKIVEVGVAHSHILHGDKSSSADNSSITLPTEAAAAPAAEAAEQPDDLSPTSYHTADAAAPAAPQDEDISSWRPMTEAFYSPTNMYSLDPEDAEVILTGYKSKDSEMARCRDFAKRGHCRRGENCPYEHILEREGAVTEDRKEVICTDSTISLPVEGSYVVAELTSVMSPSHFYVILPFGSKSINDIVGAAMSDTGSSQGGHTDPETEAEEEDFSQFQQHLNDHYNGEPFIRNDMVAYACGEIVVAKFTEDETYYRARVVDSDFDNRQVKVFFVDFGNAEWTSHNNIREMLPRFLHLPFQAIECVLDVEPAGGGSEWTREETEFFSQLAEAKYLICKPKSCNQGANCMNVELIDATSGTDIWIDQALVDAGIAKRTGKPAASHSTAASPEKICQYLPG